MSDAEDPSRFVYWATKTKRVYMTPRTLAQLRDALGLEVDTSTNPTTSVFTHKVNS